MKFKTIDDFDFNGKTALVRVDLNCSVDEKTKRIAGSDRIIAHAVTVEELAKKKAKVVVLAHQGRKGEYDCIPLEQHAKLLSEKAHVAVKFVPDVAGEKAKGAIRAMKPGEVVLLDNVRFLDDETKGAPQDAKIVRELAPLAQVFVLDAFSVAHRAQASVVGFAGEMPVVAGRIMEMELTALNRMENPKKPVMFLLGGAKPEDSMPILEKWLEEGKVKKAMACGVMGNLFLLASGKKLGPKTEKFLEEKGALKDLEKAKQLLEKYPLKIEFPNDVAYEENGKRAEAQMDALPVDGQIMDIGVLTAKHYMKHIAEAGTVLMNGPAGVYEKEQFGMGTEFLLRAIEHASGFTLLGGGHTLAALDKFRIDKRKIGYISLAGKALIEFLSGDELPGVKMLEKYANK